MSEEEELWSVYVGDVEVNNFGLTYKKAMKVADIYREKGYDDVEVDLMRRVP